MITTFRTEEVPLVLEATERMHAHLTAAIVSNDPLFVQVQHRMALWDWVRTVQKGSGAKGICTVEG